ncbi:hypothetical protein EDB80DRAFT_735395 [Ilyonectria destructans]|nr:hypothetical protein EDB80DRAFT_735395 [Ilyonectria destructans]
MSWRIRSRYSRSHFLGLHAWRVLGSKCYLLHCYARGLDQTTCARSLSALGLLITRHKSSSWRTRQFISCDADCSCGATAWPAPTCVIPGLDVG